MQGCSALCVEIDSAANRGKLHLTFTFTEEDECVERVQGKLSNRFIYCMLKRREVLLVFACMNADTDLKTFRRKQLLTN